MQVGHFPASAANALAQGYCADFVSLAAPFAQTLEQISMRGLNFDASRDQLESIAVGMHDLSVAIRDMLNNSGTTGPADTNVDGGDDFHGSAASEQATTPNFCDQNPTEDGLSAGAKAPLPGSAVTTDSPAAPPDDSPQDADTDDPVDQADDDAIARFVSNTTDLVAFRAAETARPEDSPHDLAALSSAPTGTPTQEAPATTPPAAARLSAMFDETEPKRASKNRKNARSAGATGSAESTRAANTDGGLRGTNASMPILSVFQFLERTRKNGQMEVRVDDEVIAFEFEKGCVQACTSTNPHGGERIGELLVEIGVCTQETLTQLLTGSDESSNVAVGELIVREGIASNGQLLEALEMQVQRRFLRVCAATDAHYEFHDRPPAATDGRIRLTPAELAFEPRVDRGS